MIVQIILRYIQIVEVQFPYRYFNIYLVIIATIMLAW